MDDFGRELDIGLTVAMIAISGVLLAGIIHRWVDEIRERRRVRRILRGDDG